MKCPRCRHHLPLSRTLSFRIGRDFVCPNCRALCTRKNYRNFFAITVPLVIFCIAVVIPEVREHELSFLASATLYGAMIALVVLFDALTTKLRVADDRTDRKPDRSKDDQGAS